MRREDGSEEASIELPPGYRLEAGGGNLLVLRRSDGSAVTSFAFSAFGPTPEAVRGAAEEDLRKGRRQASSEGFAGKEGRDR